MQCEEEWVCRASESGQRASFPKTKPRQPPLFACAAKKSAVHFRAGRMSNRVPSPSGKIVTRCATCGASAHHHSSDSVALWSDIHRFETYDFRNDGLESFSTVREHRVERVYLTRDGREVDFTHCHRARS